MMKLTAMMSETVDSSESLHEWFAQSISSLPSSSLIPYTHASPSTVEGNGLQSRHRQFESDCVLH
jgi:hypothetical protein